MCINACPFTLSANVSKLLLSPFLNVRLQGNVTLSCLARSKDSRMRRVMIGELCDLDGDMEYKLSDQRR